MTCFYVQDKLTYYEEVESIGDRNSNEWKMLWEHKLLNLRNIIDIQSAKRKLQKENKPEM